MAASVSAAQPERRETRGAAQLEASGLQVRFGGVHAVDGVDLVLRRGEILGLIGPNGAGKTTLVNALSGFQRPTAGRVVARRNRRHRLEPLTGSPATVSAAPSSPCGSSRT